MRYLILFIFAIGGTFILMSHQSATSETSFDKGKILFKAYSCNQCHAVSAVGMEALTKVKKEKGSDLSGFKSESAVTIDHFKTVMHKDMSDWDKASQELIKGFKGTDEELQTILDWLGSLEAQE